MDNFSLKNSIFGYKKSSVNELLHELISEHEIKVSALAEEKGKLMDKIVLLEEKIEKLEAEVEVAKTEKEYVSSAIILAEKEAAEILKKAEAEAEEIRSNNAEAMKSETSKLDDLRLSTMQAMQAYKVKLDAIAKRLGLGK